MSMLLFLLLVGVGIEGVLGSTLQMGNPGSLRTASNVKQGEWWSKALFYKINPRYFKDSDDNCIGDLKGIADKVEYLKEMNVDAVVLSNINPAYNNTDVDPDIGNLPSFGEMIRSLSNSNIMVILELDLSSTSTEHPWFTSHPSYYFRADKRPNNWLTHPHYGGASAWVEYNTTDYYLSFFEKSRAQLNLTNPQVKSYIDEVLDFWISQGVAGFKLPGIPYLAPSNHLENEPRSFCQDDIYKCYNHSVTTNTKEALDIFKSWSKLVNDGTGGKGILIVDVSGNSEEEAEDYIIQGANLVLNDVERLFNRGGDRLEPPQLEKWAYIATNLAWTWSDYHYELYPSMAKDILNIITALLPGTYIPLSGNEIAMTSASKGFKWDATKFAGFTKNNTCPSPYDVVDLDYYDSNLEKEKGAKLSHYVIFEKLNKIRSYIAQYDLQYLNVTSEDDKSGEQFYSFSRTSATNQFIVLFNRGYMEHKIDLSKVGITNGHLNVEVPSLSSTYQIGDSVETGNIVLRPLSVVVLSNGSVSHLISFALLLLSLARFLL